jgi:hypothetical protein
VRSQRIQSKSRAEIEFSILGMQVKEYMSKGKIAELNRLKQIKK